MKTFKKIGILIVGAFCLVGCGSDNDLSEVSGQQGAPGSPLPIVSPTPTPTNTTQARLRLANPIESFDNLVVRLDGQVIEADLDGLEATNYQQVTGGQHTLTVSNSGGELATSTFTLAGSSFSTVVVYPEQTAISAREIRAQQTFSTELLVLTDNVTPSVGFITGRLVNAFQFTQGNLVANFLSAQNQDLLLGPVSSGQAGPYQTRTTAQVNFLGGFLANFTGFTTGVIGYDTFEGDGFTVIRELAGQVSGTGVNITIILAPGIASESLGNLVMLVDDASTGNTVLVAPGEERISSN